MLVFRAGHSRAVGHHEDEVDIVDGLFCGLVESGSKFVFRFMDPGCINEDNLIVVGCCNAENPFAGRLYFVADYADFVPHDGVDEGAFSDVWFSDDGYESSFHISYVCGRGRLLPFARMIRHLFVVLGCVFVLLFGDRKFGRHRRLGEFLGQDLRRLDRRLRFPSLMV